MTETRMKVAADEGVGREVDWMLAIPAEIAQQLADAVRATVEERTPPVQLQAMYRALGWRLVAWYLTRILGTPGVSDGANLLPRGVLPEGDEAARERYERSRVVIGRTDSRVVVEAGRWRRWFHDWHQAAQFVGGMLELARLGATVDSQGGPEAVVRRVDD